MPTLVAGDKVLANFDTDQLEEISERARNRALMLFGLFLTLGVAVLSVALRSYQTSFAQKAGALGILVASFLAVYFVTGSWVLRFGRGAQLAVSALAGNSHPHSRLAFAQGKSAPAEKSALGGYFPDARTKSRTKSKTRDSSTSTMRVGTGRIIGSFSGFFTRRKTARRRRFA